MVNKFNELVRLCKGSVTITANEHTTNHETAEQYIGEPSCAGCGMDDDEILPEVRNKIIELNSVIEVQFYPHTPIGFYKVAHYDVVLALDQALEIAKAGDR